MNAYEIAIQHWGVEAQLRKTIEELRELETETRRALDNNLDRNNMISEIADVLNMLQQLQIIYNIPTVEVFKEIDRKMERTMQRIEKEREGNE